MAKKFVFLPLVLGLLLQGVVSANAQRYLLNLTASYKSTNDAGVVTMTKMSAPSLLNEIFADVAVARQHSLVFDIQTGEVLVIQRASGEVLGTWYQFTIDTAVTSADGKNAETYWNVTCPSDDGYAGTAVGTVQVTKDGEGQVTKFKMNGKFTLRYQADGSPSRVYNGVFTTGARYVAP